MRRMPPAAEPANATAPATAPAPATVEGAADAPRRPPRRVGRGIALAVVGVLLAGLAVAATHAWWLGPYLSSRLTASSGRDVRIERVVVTWSPSGGLQVALGGVRIANAAWADPAWPFAEAREVVARVALARTLAERRPVIAELVLDRARIDLERQADGLRNWRLRDPQDRGPGRYKVLSLTARHSEVRFVHGGIGLVLEASARPAAGAEPLLPSGERVAAAAGAASAAADDDAARRPTRIDLRARWRGVDFGGRFDTAPTLTFLETGRAVPLRGRLALRGVTVELDGDAGDLFRAPRVDARLAVRAAAVEPVRAAVRVARSRVAAPWSEMQVPLRDGAWPAAAKPAFALDTQLHVEPRRIAFEALRARFGDSDVAGRVAWEQEGRADVETAVQAAASTASAAQATGTGDGARASSASASASASAVRPFDTARAPAPAPRRLRITRLAVDAQSERVVLEQLRDALSGWSSDDAADPPASATGRASAPASAASDVEAAPTRRWPDADIRYRATRARWDDGGPALGPLRVEATVRDQRVDVSTLELGLAGGRVEGRAHVDGQVQPPRAQATLRIDGVDVAALRPVADPRKRVTGRLAGQAQLRAGADDAKGWLASLDGRVDLTLRDGTLPALIDAELGLQTFRIARHLLGTPQAVPLRCAALALDLRDGVARVRQLVLDSDRTRTQGRGRIDLAARTLDLTLTGETKGRALLVLDRSIHLHGPLAKPAHELVPRVELSSPACRAG